MNKLFINIALFSLLSITACAQSTPEKKSEANDVQIRTETFDENKIENDEELNLNLTQKEKIRELNRNIGAKFRAIGQDRSLSGYEKGQKKRELALQHKKEIYEILNSSQKERWENSYGGHHGTSIKDDITDRIDDRIDALEDKYETQKKAVEKNDNLSKVEKKTQKKELERMFKAEKKKLKLEKDEVRSTSLLKEQ